MVLTREQRDTHEYLVHNADKTPRQLVIEHPAREGWALVDGGAKPEETTASFLRFRLNVAAGATEHLRVEERHPESDEFKLDDMDDKKLAVLVENRTLTTAAQQAIRSVLDHKNALGLLEGEISSCQREVDSIGKDQARLRENMKALKGSSEERALVQRYARQLDQQEDRINVLQKQISELNGKKDKADVELDQTIQAIVMDESL
jgi:flagellar biosynthesis chaperone FliJ